MDTAHITEHTRRWVSSVVTGLGLCPFAERVAKADRIRYAVYAHADWDSSKRDFAKELNFLVDAPREETETALLIFPNASSDFCSFNEWVLQAQDLIEELELDDFVQAVAFHPAFEFADSTPEAVENFTNRSPYPTIHLLRQQSITELPLSEKELLEIPNRNTQTLRRLGQSEITRILKSCEP